MGIRSLIKGGLKFGIGAARFAGQELRERLGKKQEPNANMPHNPEPPEQAGLEHQLEEEAMRPVAALDVKDLKVELDSANPPLLLDCRELHEWEAGYIRGCLHVPMNSIPERLAELDPSRRTIVYCLHGIRSAQVTSWLQTAQGFRDVASLDGGIVSWYSEFNQERIVVRRSEEK